jgi:hypothetical protein
VTASFGNNAVFLTEKERSKEKMYYMQRKEDQIRDFKNEPDMDYAEEWESRYLNDVLTKFY